MNENMLGTNFHVFYWLVDQAPVQLKEKLKLTNKFAVNISLLIFLVMNSMLLYVNFLSIQILPTKSASKSYNETNFDSLDKALEAVGISNIHVYGLLAGILHLGNVNLKNDCGYANISQDSFQYLRNAADCLSLDLKQLESAFLEKKLMIQMNQSSVV